MTRDSLMLRLFLFGLFSWTANGQELGRTVTKIVDEDTQVPGTRVTFDFFEDASRDGEVVVFVGGAHGDYDDQDNLINAPVEGIYQYREGKITTLIDSNSEEAKVDGFIFDSPKIQDESLYFISSGFVEEGIWGIHQLEGDQLTTLVDRETSVPRNSSLRQDGDSEFSFFELLSVGGDNFAFAASVSSTFIHAPSTPGPDALGPIGEIYTEAKGVYAQIDGILMNIIELEGSDYVQHLSIDGEDVAFSVYHSDSPFAETGEAVYAYLDSALLQIADARPMPDTPGPVEEAMFSRFGQVVVNDGRVVFVGYGPMDEKLRDTCRSLPL